MSIYVKHDTSSSTVSQIEAALQKVEGVKELPMWHQTKLDKNYAEDNKDNPRALSALNLADAKFPGTFRVNVEDINDTAALMTIRKDKRSI